MEEFMEFVSVYVVILAGVVAVGVGIFTFTRPKEEQTFINPWIFTIFGSILAIFGVINYFINQSGILP
jgi:hypothetical protein